MSDFVSDVTMGPLSPSSKEVKHFALRHSENSPHEWLVVYGDGWYTTLIADRYEPWMGRVVARFHRGKKVA